MDFEPESEPKAELDAEDILALYLLEHPEDDAGVGTATFTGAEENIIKGPVLLRLARWGIEKGYFDPEKVRRDMQWMEQAQEASENDEA
jgi:hypothetical protein